MTQTTDAVGAARKDAPVLLTTAETPTPPAASVNAAVAAAAAATAALAGASRDERARWLTVLAEALDSSITRLVDVADAETHLGATRLSGEVGRTSGQLRLFAEVLREGSYLEATIDPADPGATPPRPDLRRILVPLGPVAVYAASNFPFAFSVLGGDTAAAIAAGSPVVVKAHPGHPRLSRVVAELAINALRGAGAPDGALSLVEGFDAGIELVQHPDIRAAAFTGSVNGGRALFDLAASRPVPIPFFGELGSLNPVVLTRAGVEERGDDLATGLVASVTLGVGQFCTKPGLVFAPAGTGFDARVREVTSDSVGGVMLTEAMREHHHDGVQAAAALTGVELTRSASGDAATEQPALLCCDVDTLLAHGDELLAEHFGPSTVLVSYTSSADLHRALSAVPGGLTATIHAGADEEIADLVDALRPISGRILFGGWPTGVAVSWAQHHGGPYPATTSQFTSVGATAIRRFLRPIAYQSAPQRVLPLELRDGAADIPRRINGVLTLPSER